MNRPLPPRPLNHPATSPNDTDTGLAAGLPATASEGLAHIKPAVRDQPGYTLVSPPVARKLNQNELPIDFPPELKQAVFEQVLGQPWQRYPEFVPQQLVDVLARHYGWVSDGILVGNGSNELIQATLSVTLGPGDRVVAPAPTFSLYRLLTNVMGGRYIPVPLGHDFGYDVDRLVETARSEQARLILLNSPNNPTGSALPRGAVERLLHETDALVVCDEAYQEFGGPTAVPLLARSSRLVVLRTFSKAFGLAGLRFGVALAHPAIAREIAKGKLPYNVGIVTLATAQVALEHAPMLKARTQAVIATRERFVRRLQDIPGVSAYPTSANFVLVRCRGLPAIQVFSRLHHEYGILVRDVSRTPELAECLRISIGTDEDMDAVIDALDHIFSNGSKEAAAVEPGEPPGH